MAEIQRDVFPVLQREPLVASHTIPPVASDDSIALES
jgi:hypothetical protein